MELEAVGPPLIAEGLRLEILPPGQKGCSAWQIETFPVPLINMAGKPAIADAMSVLRRMDGVIADLHPPLRVGTDAVTKMASEHLRAQTNAEKRRVFLKGDSNPIYFVA